MFRVRGTLVSTLSLAENFGILLSYVIGNYCNFYATPQFSIVLTTLFAILFCLFPESPLMLVKCKKTDVSKNLIFNSVIFIMANTLNQFTCDFMTRVINSIDF